MPRSSAGTAISGIGSTMPSMVLGADPTMSTVLSVTAAWYAGTSTSPSDVSGVDTSFSPK